MSSITAALARRLLQTSHFGLPNLVMDERLVPEFLQERVRTDVIAPVLLDLLEEGSDARNRQLAGLVRLRERLGQPGASERVASIAEELIGGVWS